MLHVFNTLFPDVATAYPDKKSILMYVTSLFQVLPQQVTLEAIQEVETLPRLPKHIGEEHVQLHQQRFSQQVSTAGFYWHFFGQLKVRSYNCLFCRKEMVFI